VPLGAVEVCVLSVQGTSTRGGRLRRAAQLIRCARTLQVATSETYRCGVLWLVSKAALGFANRVCKVPMWQSVQDNAASSC